MTATETEQLRRAQEYAARKHAGQLRIGGAPYITHPTAVAKMLADAGYGADYQLTALFHDLLEDTDATEEEILSLSNARVLHAVQLLTKRPGYVMADYMSGVCSDELAMRVKIADRIHNLSTASCADEHFRRRYIDESRTWFCPISPKIESAVKRLEATLSGAEHCAG